MPNYGTLPLTGAGSGVPATVLAPGEGLLLFGTVSTSTNALTGAITTTITGESPTSPQASIAFNLLRNASLSPSVVFTIAAGSGTVQIQGSNQDVASTYQTLHTSTSAAADFYADSGGFAFYRANLSAGSGPVTVIAQVS